MTSMPSMDVVTSATPEDDLYNTTLCGAALVLAAVAAILVSIFISRRQSRGASDQPEFAMEDLLDVDALKPWDKKKHGSVEKAFNQQFSMVELMQSLLSATGAPMGEDPDQDARQDVMLIGRMCDNGITRGLIQMDDDSEAIVVDLVTYKGKSVWYLEEEEKADDEDEGEAVEGGDAVPKAKKDKKIPIIFVRYAYHTKKDSNVRKCASSVMDTMPASGMIQKITSSSRQEMQILNALFLHNSNKIPEDFRRGLEGKIRNRKMLQMPQSRTSYVSFLMKPGDGMAPKHVCSRCGIPSKAACVRCKTAHYCSKECQTADWKVHKKVCVTPEQAAQTEEDSDRNNNNKNKSEKGAGAAARAASDDSSDAADNPWVDINQHGGPNDMYFATISHHRSMRNSLNPTIQAPNKVVFGKKVARDVKMTVKVQIQLGSRAKDGQPMMIYPQGKKWELMAFPESTVGGQAQYARLHELVHTKGLSIPGYTTGCKAYLDAYVTQEGTLRVMLNKLHPLQRW